MITYEKEIDIVKSWAKSNPLIKKAYFFGSRYKGTNREDSDIDIAVELIKPPRDANLLATWVFEGKKLQEELQALLGYEVDLQWYSNEKDTPEVYKYINENSLIIYE